MKMCLWTRRTYYENFQCNILVVTEISGGAAILRLLYGCDIPRRARIDNSVEFPHHALGVVIAPDAIIEENVIIQHHATIAVSKKGQKPIVRKGAYIGAYALILGDVEIGENSTIGAGAVVTKSVPANGVYISRNELIDIRKGKVNENIGNT